MTLLWCSVVTAAEGYVGAQTCGGCHPAQFAAQSRSHHANALHRGSEIGRFSYLPEGVTVAGAAYDFTKTDAGYRVAISYGQDKAVLPIDWIVGANDQGLTFLSKLAPRQYVEHRLSYYRRKPGYDITAGQNPAPPRSVAMAVGAHVSAREASRCLGCHSTYLKNTADGPEYDSVIAGVTCERCHGPGAAHTLTVKSGSRDRRIENPGRRSGDELLAMCGECHRTEPPPGVAHDEPIVTRFQPVGLQMSACFQSSNGALTCTTCHNPHEDARRGDDKYYEAKCQSCHSKSSAKHCTVNSRDGCIGCHMPKVQPLSWVSFSDHWIRPQGIRPR